MRWIKKYGKPSHRQAGTRDRASGVNSLAWKQAGQGMTEYLIVVALVAVSAVVVYRFLGSTIQNKTASIAQSIAEQDSSVTESAAKAAANNAAQAAQKSDRLRSGSD